MKKIEGQPKTLRQLLTGVKYTIQYYQREYLWGTDQIEELIEDLTNEFSLFYETDHERKKVASYGSYFMGSIIIANSDSENAIIDGQQRLTSLTLLLIYLNHLQKNRTDKVDIQNLIFSEQFGIKSFNIDVHERFECMSALFAGNDFDSDKQPESVRNVFNRYGDIVNLFPEDRKDNSLPFFIDWLIDKVEFIEIIAQTEQDAHKIFITMNDRGLSLTPADMLKSYLLSKIENDDVRNKANEIWKKKIIELKDLGKEQDSNFIKNWLRAQYAQTIRESKKGAIKEDFDIIGTSFHKWVREKDDLIGLNISIDYERFIIDEFTKYVDINMKLIEYSNSFNPDFEYIFYNANNNFTFQYQILLASIHPEDNKEIIEKKVKLVSCFIDQFIMSRAINFKTVDYSSIRNMIFSLTKKIRRLDFDLLKRTLIDEINEMTFKIDGVDNFYLNGFTSRYMRHILARLTNYIEKESGINSKFEDYVNREISNPYDVEHILTDKYSKYRSDFEDETEFERFRNKFGALLLLTKDKNRSYKDKLYRDKLEMYFSDNLLAKSLNEKCYINNPLFLNLIANKRLNFKSYLKFDKDAINARQDLYKDICKCIWNTEKLALF